MIRFTCPVCNKRLKAPDEGVGRKTHCPRCGQSLLVPPPVWLESRNQTVLSQPETSPCLPGRLDDVQRAEDKHGPPIAFRPSACEPVDVEPADSTPHEMAIDSLRGWLKRVIVGMALATIPVIVLVAVLGAGGLSSRGITGHITKAEFERIVYSARSRQEIIDKLGRPDVVWPENIHTMNSRSEDDEGWERWGWDNYVVDPVSHRAYQRSIIVFQFESSIVLKAKYFPILKNN